MLGYGRQPQPEDFYRYIRKNSLLEVAGAIPGDVGLFDFGSGPQHVALFTPRGIIHAYAPARKVIEHGFQAPWPPRLCGLYRFPHIQESD
jgi:cell wall-associated NlpC family hydrolase